MVPRSRYAVRATHEVEDRRLSLFGRSIKNASYADGTGRLLYYVGRRVSASALLNPVHISHLDVFPSV